MENNCDELRAKPNIVVAIGGSAGAVKSIIEIVEQLPEWFLGTLVVATHRSPEKENILRDVLSRRARVEVVEPEDKDCLVCTKIYVGHPRDKVEVDEDAFDITADWSHLARIRRVDDLFKSVAESVGETAVGVVLSGMLSDGADGLRAIQDAGGYCIVQSPAEAEFSSMPVAAIEATDVHFVGSASEIVSKIMELSIYEQNR